MAEMELNFNPAICPNCKELDAYQNDDRDKFYACGEIEYYGKVEFGCTHYKVCYKMKEEESKNA